MKKVQTAEEIITAKKKEAGINSIDPNFELENGLSLATYRGKITDAETLLEMYNGTLANAEAIKSKYLGSIAELRDYTRRFITGIESKFGPDSVEFGKAGAVRRSLRKHRAKKTKAA